MSIDGSQERYWDYYDEVDARTLNHSRLGLLPPGIYSGLDVWTYTSVGSAISQLAINPGVYMTKEGANIKILAGLDHSILALHPTENDTKRAIAIGLYHKYETFDKQSGSPSQASIMVFTGKVIAYSATDALAIEEVEDVVNDSSYLPYFTLLAYVILKRDSNGVNISGDDTITMADKVSWQDFKLTPDTEFDAVADNSVIFSDRRLAIGGTPPSSFIEGTASIYAVKGVTAGKTYYPTSTFDLATKKYVDEHPDGGAWTDLKDGDDVCGARLDGLASSAKARLEIGVDGSTYGDVRIVGINEDECGNIVFDHEEPSAGPWTAKLSLNRNVLELSMPEGTPRIKTWNTAALGHYFTYDGTIVVGALPSVAIAGTSTWAYALRTEISSTGLEVTKGSSPTGWVGYRKITANETYPLITDADYSLRVAARKLTVGVTGFLINPLGPVQVTSNITTSATTFLVGGENEDGASVSGLLQIYAGDTSHGLSFLRDNVGEILTLKSYAPACGISFEYNNSTFAGFGRGRIGALTIGAHLSIGNKTSQHIWFGGWTANMVDESMVEVSPTVVVTGGTLAVRNSAQRPYYWGMASAYDDLHALYIGRVTAGASVIHPNNAAIKITDAGDIVEVPHGLTVLGGGFLVDIDGNIECADIDCTDITSTGDISCVDIIAEDITIDSLSLTLESVGSATIDGVAVCGIPVVIDADGAHTTVYVLAATGAIS